MFCDPQDMWLATDENGATFDWWPHRSCADWPAFPMSVYLDPESGGEGRVDALRFVGDWHIKLANANLYGQRNSSNGTWEDLGLIDFISEHPFHCGDGISFFDGQDCYADFDGYQGQQSYYPAHIGGSFQRLKLTFVDSNCPEAGGIIFKLDRVLGYCSPSMPPSSPPAPPALPPPPPSPPPVPAPEFCTPAANWEFTDEFGNPYNWPFLACSDVNLPISIYMEPTSGFLNPPPPANLEATGNIAGAATNAEGMAQASLVIAIITFIWLALLTFAAIKNKREDDKWRSGFTMVSADVKEAPGTSSTTKD